MDFGKFQFDTNKRKSMSHKKQRVARVQIKELKFGIRIEEADYQVKLRNLIRFLDQGNKVKVTLRFRGREIAFQDIGIDLMNRIRANAEAYAVVEQEPKLEGRQIVMVLGPKKN
jgi:translation initiation factor IF-3